MSPIKFYRWATVALAVILAFVLFRLNQLDSSKNFYIYVPNTGVLFILHAKPAYGVGRNKILNPFVKLEFRLPGGLLENRGKLSEIQKSIDYYNNIPLAEATDFQMAQFRIDLDKLIINWTSRGRRSENPLSLLPKQWEWLRKAQIGEKKLCCLNVIDLAVLERQSNIGDDVLFFPTVLLVHGYAATLLDQNHYGTFKEISEFIRKDG